MMKKQYSQPELEVRLLVVDASIANDLGSGDTVEMTPDGFPASQGLSETPGINGVG